MSYDPAVAQSIEITRLFLASLLVPKLREGRLGCVFLRCRFLDPDINLTPGPGQHGGQVIQAEKVELAPCEIGDSGWVTPRCLAASAWVQPCALI